MPSATSLADWQTGAADLLFRSLCWIDLAGPHTCLPAAWVQASDGPLPEHLTQLVAHSADLMLASNFRSGKRPDGADLREDQEAQIKLGTSRRPRTIGAAAVAGGSHAAAGWNDSVRVETEGPALWLKWSKESPALLGASVPPQALIFIAPALPTHRRLTADPHALQCVSKLAEARVWCLEASL